MINSIIQASTENIDGTFIVNINYSGHICSIHLSSPLTHHELCYLKEILDDQILSGFYVIKIPNMKLCKIPTDILYLDIDIKSFCLSYNHISTMPLTLEESIETLILDHNKFSGETIIPNKVETIYLDGNDISNLHISKDTKKIIARYNRISSVTGLYDSLITLNIGHNELNTLDISQSRIENVDCCANLLEKLPKLPTSVIALNISSNCITGVLDITSLSNMTTLNCTNNDITKIKMNKALRVLYASGVRIKKFALDMSHLSHAHLCSSRMYELTINTLSFNNIIVRDNPLNKIILNKCLRLGYIEFDSENLNIITPFHFVKNMLHLCSTADISRISLHSAVYCIQTCIRSKILGKNSLTRDNTNSDDELHLEI